MQNVILMVKNALSQNFVVYFNFSTYENRVRMEVHDAAISEYFSDSLALKNPDLLVDLSLFFIRARINFSLIITRIELTTLNSKLIQSQVWSRVSS